MKCSGQSRQQYLSKRTVADVAEIYKHSSYCVTLAIKPTVGCLTDEEQTQRYLNLKHAMQKHFKSYGWFRLPLLAFAGADGEMVERNEHPVYGCVSIWF